MTKQEAMKHLRGYADYVGCGCNHKRSRGGCRMEATCARADYLRTLAKLRTPGGNEGSDKETGRP